MIGRSGCPEHHSRTRRRKERTKLRRSDNECPCNTRRQTGEEPSDSAGLVDLPHCFLEIGPLPPCGQLARHQCEHLEDPLFLPAYPVNTCIRVLRTSIGCMIVRAADLAPAAAINLSANVTSDGAFPAVIRP
eukprot:scaffold1913_cov257-Pinguiococcus_pyrenoidosus.AAC.24